MTNVPEADASVLGTALTATEQTGLEDGNGVVRVLQSDVHRAPASLAPDLGAAGAMRNATQACSSLLAPTLCPLQLDFPVGDAQLLMRFHASGGRTVLSAR